MDSLDTERASKMISAVRSALLPVVRDVPDENFSYVVTALFVIAVEMLACSDPRSRSVLFNYALLTLPQMFADAAAAVDEHRASISPQAGTA